MVNKGIYLNGDNGATFLHFGNYKDSCISDPTLCGPAGEFLSLFSDVIEVQLYMVIDVWQLSNVFLRFIHDVIKANGSKLSLYFSRANISAYIKHFVR